MTEALSEGINSDLLPLFESVSDISPPDALDTKVGELHSHLVVVDVHRADALLTSISAHAGGRDEVVRVSLGNVRVVSDTADHHHCRALVANYLDLGECLLLSTGPLPLKGPRPPPLTLVAEPQLVRGWLLENSHGWLLFHGGDLG